jgi:hypothetical protein
MLDYYIEVSFFLFIIERPLVYIIYLIQSRSNVLRSLLVPIGSSSTLLISPLTHIPYECIRPSFTKIGNKTRVVKTCERILKKTKYEEMQYTVQYYLL